MSQGFTELHTDDTPPVTLTPHNSWRGELDESLADKLDDEQSDESIRVAVEYDYLSACVTIRMREFGQRLDLVNDPAVADMIDEFFLDHTALDEQIRAATAHDQLLLSHGAEQRAVIEQSDINRLTRQKLALYERMISVMKSQHVANVTRSVKMATGHTSRRRTETRSRERRSSHGTRRRTTASRSAGGGDDGPAEPEPPLAAAFSGGAR